MAVPLDQDPSEPESSATYHPGWEDGHIVRGSLDPALRPETAQTQAMPAPLQSITDLDVTLTTGNGEAVNYHSSKLSLSGVRRRNLAKNAGDAAALREFADYNLSDVIGSGGMGMVFLAHQQALQRPVAVKVMRDDRADDQRAVAFMAEAWVTGVLDHPNIVPIYDAALDQDGMPFYSMRRIHGQPWNRRMAQMEVDDNVQVLLRVADAVAYAHDQGILHRDLKPQNIMLGEYGEVMVLDWGLAVACRAGARAPALDRGNVLAGTPSYVPPETARGEIAEVGIGSDVYLLGGILLQIITGHPPRHGASVAVALSAAARNDLPELSCDPIMASIIGKALATKVSDRYASVKDFQQALVQWRRHRRSMFLSERAEKMLATISSGDAEGGYDAFNQALFTIDQATEEWPENPQAQYLRFSIQLAFAKRAHERGDLDLAASQIPDADLAATCGLGKEVARISADVVYQQAHRQRRQRQLIILQRSVTALVVLLILGLSTGYVLVDRARQASERDRDALAKANVQLAEEQNATAAAHAELHVAHQRLQIDVVAHRMGEILRSQDMPVVSIPALERLAADFPVTQSWPWYRLLYLAGHGYQRIGRDQDEQRLMRTVIDPQGILVAAIREDGRAWLIPLDDPHTAQPLASGPGFVTRVLWSEAGELVVLLTNDGKLYVFSRDGQEIARESISHGTHLAIAFHPRDRSLIINHGQELIALDGRNGKRRWSVPSPAAHRLQFSHDGNQLLLTDGERQLTLVAHDRGTMIPTELRAYAQPKQLGFADIIVEPSSHDPYVEHGGATFVPWAPGLVVLADDFRIYGIDPETGASRPLTEALENPEQFLSSFAQGLHSLKVGSEHLVMVSGRSATHIYRRQGDDNSARLEWLRSSAGVASFLSMGSARGFLSTTNRGYPLLTDIDSRRMLALNFHRPISALHLLKGFSEDEYLTVSGSGHGHRWRIADPTRNDFKTQDDIYQELNDIALLQGTALRDWRVFPRDRSRSARLVAVDGSGAVSQFSPQRLAGKLSTATTVREVVGYYANAMAPHGPWLLVGGGSIQDLRRADNLGQHDGQLQLSFGRFRIRAAEVSADRTRLVVMDINGNADVFAPAAGGEPLFTAQRSQEAVVSVAFAPQQVILGRIPQHGGIVHRVSPHGPARLRLLAASMTDSSSVHIHDANSGTELMSFPHPNYVLLLAYDASTQALVSVDMAGTIRRWDVSSGTLLASAASGLADAVSGDVHEGSRRMVIYDTRGNSRIVDFDLQIHGQAPVARQPVFHAVFGPGGKEVAELHADGELRIWHSQTQTILHRENIGDAAMGSRHLNWFPVLTWCHESNQLMVHVKGFKAFRIERAESTALDVGRLLPLATGENQDDAHAQSRATAFQRWWSGAVAEDEVEAKAEASPDESPADTPD